MARIRVAFLTTDNREHFKDYRAVTPYFGMAPQALLQGFEKLPEIEVHVVSCARAPMVSPAKLAPNIYFHGLHVPKLGWMRTAYQGCIRAVRRKLKETGPDIVHGQGTELDCALNAVFSGFPNVVTIHGNMAEMARLERARPGSFLWCASIFENFALKRTAGVLCNSHHTEALVRRRARRTWAIPNALRPGFFDPPVLRARNSRCVILHIGAVCPNKQQLKMLEMARSLSRQTPELEFQFLGPIDTSNSYAQSFLQQLKQAERDGYARHSWTGSVEELIGHYDRANALVHTPQAEAFGLVVAEALSRNLKFFGFRVGGVPDIAEGVDGAELVEADNWRQLETSVSRWVRDGHPSAGAGAAAVMKARYCPQEIARQHLAIYDEVLSGSR